MDSWGGVGPACASQHGSGHCASRRIGIAQARGVGPHKHGARRRGSAVDLRIEELCRCLMPRAPPTMLYRQCLWQSTRPRPRQGCNMCKPFQTPWFAPRCSRSLARFDSAGCFRDEGETHRTGDIQTAMVSGLAQMPCSPASISAHPGFINRSVQGKTQKSSWDRCCLQELRSWPPAPESAWGIGSAPGTAFPHSFPSKSNFGSTPWGHSQFPRHSPEHFSGHFLEVPKKHSKSTRRSSFGDSP